MPAAVALTRPFESIVATVPLTTAQVTELVMSLNTSDLQEIEAEIERFSAALIDA